MGIVLYYLIRLEPFTALHRHLQVSSFLMEVFWGTFGHMLHTGIAFFFFLGVLGVSETFLDTVMCTWSGWQI